jgi:hypothetical protein
MAEIKSTLDLVMEKTKHLTLSKEEKKEQEHIEVSKKLKGLLQKYHDNLFKKEKLIIELESLKKTYDLKINKILAQMILDDLKLGHNNKWFFKLLNEICVLDTYRLEKMFIDFLNKIEIAAEKRIKKIKENFAKEHSISGSAVVPNLETDNEWLSTFEKIKVKFDKALNMEKADLMA